MGRQLQLFGGPRQRGRQLPPPKENVTQAQVAGVLERWGNPGWFCTHFPAGGHRDVVTGAQLKRAGTKRGVPDFMLLAPTALAHFLELKREGETLSDPQQAFADYCNDKGYPHAVADTFDAAIAVLKHWRVVRVTVSA